MKSCSLRERLMEAGTKVFAQKGYAGASVNEIARKAGASKPVLYYYFKNKEGLYLAILSYGFEERMRLIREAFSAPADWRERLVKMVDAVLCMAQKRQDLCKVTFHAAFAPKEEAPRGIQLQKRGRRLIEAFQSFIKQGVKEEFFRKDTDVRMLAAALHGQLLFYGLMQMLNPSVLPPRLRAEEIVEIFLNGAKQ
ncbi:MAG: TetR/AcrR family transcriptional regulator [Verrucomicrobiota bacterium]